MISHRAGPWLKVLYTNIRRRFLWVAFALFYCASAEALVVLQYHHISDDTPPSTSTSPELFKQHLAFLAEHNFQVLPITAVGEYWQAGKPLPKRAVVITFDDGYRSIYDTAWPMLKRYGWPFTVFVSTEQHDDSQSQFMSWDELQEMAKAGVAIGNHSVTHPHLVRRQASESEQQWRKRVREEIVAAQKTIVRRVGEQPRVFAYPYGEYNQFLLELLADLEFIGFGQQSGPVSPLSDPQSVPRFPFGGNYGEMEDFATKVNSLPLPVDRVAIKAEDHPLEDPILPMGAARPQMKLYSENIDLLQSIQCFASGQGAIPSQLIDSRSTSHLLVQAPKNLAIGRTRYNCTASAGQGRFYWYSSMFMRRPSADQWYAE